MSITINQGVKISELTDAGALDLTEQFEILQAGANKKLSLANQLTKFNSERIDDSINAFSLLGSGAKGFPPGYTIANVSTNFSLSENTLYLIACEVRKSYTLTGVKWYQNVSGNYTADQYNGIGLYTISGGVLTLVASSTDDGNIWKASANGFASKAFSALYNAIAGVYYIGLLYNNSSQATAPSIGSVGTVGNVFYTAGDFTNGYKLHATLAAQNSLPASITMSATSGFSNKIFPFLY